MASVPSFSMMVKAVAEGRVEAADQVDGQGRVGKATVPLTTIWS